MVVELENRGVRPRREAHHPHRFNSIANFPSVSEESGSEEHGVSRGALLSEAFDQLVLRGAQDEHAPIRGAYNLDQIKRRALCAVLEGKPLEISIIWEPHAHRQEASRSDRRTTELLNTLFKALPDGFGSKLAAVLSDVKPNITLILADVFSASYRHGHSAYLGSVRDAFKRSAEGQGNGFRAIWLGDVYNQLHRSLPHSSEPISEGTQQFLAQHERVASSLHRGAQRRGLDGEHAQRYAQNILSATDVLNLILGRESLLVAIGDPSYSPLFRGVQSGVLWTRAASESGRRLSLRSPWCAGS